MGKKTRSEKDVLQSNDNVVQKRKKRKRQVLRNLLNEYSKSSTLHGLRYVTERELSVYEKTFWLITFLISVTLCCTVIVNLYIKWKSNPIIVTINENIISASKIPFPSITICPQSKCRASVFNYTDVRIVASNEFFQLSPFELAVKLGRRRKRESPYRRFSNIATVCEGNDVIKNKLRTYGRMPSNVLLVKDIEMVAEPLENVFYRCIWRGKKTNCRYLFKTVLTREGVCFNMNAIAANKLLKSENLQTDFKYMYDHITDVRGEPLSGRINGAGPDLDIVFKRNILDRDLSCNTLNNGYKIYMQHPDDLPSTSHYHYSALDSQSTSLAIKCNILNTTEDLRNNLPEERQCYFEGERNLTYFQKYTAHNCWKECLSKYIYKTCGCVGFYLPHNNSSQLCNLYDYKCIINSEDQLADLEASGNTSIGCHCLPACYDIDYSAEAAITEFNFKSLWEIENYEKFDNKFAYSRLVLFFQQPGFIAIRRTKLFGWVDFIANCGGLLGLFLGFSVLSVVEIMYFLTLRFWCTAEQILKRDDNKMKEDAYAIEPTDGGRRMNESSHI